MNITIRANFTPGQIVAIDDEIHELIPGAVVEYEKDVTLTDVDIIVDNDVPSRRYFGILTDMCRRIMGYTV
jgi:hypothetical protein